jgi:hypothetical protein
MDSVQALPATESHPSVLTCGVRTLLRRASIASRRHNWELS